MRARRVVRRCFRWRPRRSSRPCRGCGRPCPPAGAWPCAPGRRRGGGLPSVQARRRARELPSTHKARSGAATSRAVVLEWRNTTRAAPKPSPSTSRNAYRNTLSTSARGRPAPPHAFRGRDATRGFVHPISSVRSSRDGEAYPRRPFATSARRREQPRRPASPRSNRRRAPYPPPDSRSLNRRAVRRRGALGLVPDTLVASVSPRSGSEGGGTRIRHPSASSSPTTASRRPADRAPWLHPRPHRCHEERGIQSRRPRTFHVHQAYVRFRWLQPAPGESRGRFDYPG